MEENSPKLPTISVIHQDWFYLPSLGMSRNILLDCELLEVRVLGILFIGVFLRYGAALGL